MYNGLLPYWEKIVVAHTYTDRHTYFIILCSKQHTYYGLIKIDRVSMLYFNTCNQVQKYYDNHAQLLITLIIHFLAKRISSSLQRMMSDPCISECVNNTSQSTT